MPVYYLGDVEGRLYVDLDMPQGTSLEMPSAQLSEQPADITPPSRTRCTKDARQCPDGSFVSRSGPDCTFAPCPTDSLEAETIALEEQINRSGESATYDFASGIVQQYLEPLVYPLTFTIKFNYFRCITWRHIFFWFNTFSTL